MAKSPSGPVPSPDESDSLESTADLVERAKEGDTQALNRLMKRYYAPLRRLAHGRLPPNARGSEETDDLVQKTLEKAFKQIGRFEYRQNGCFLAYLRTILDNQIRDTGRAVSRRPQPVALPDDLPDLDRTPEDLVSDREKREAFERALRTLAQDDQEAVIMRIELNMPYEEITQIVGFKTANATRMRIARALTRIAGLMAEFRGDS